MAAAVSTVVIVVETELAEVVDTVMVVVGETTVMAAGVTVTKRVAVAVLGVVAAAEAEASETGGDFSNGVVVVSVASAILSECALVLPRVSVGLSALYALVTRPFEHDAVQSLPVNPPLKRSTLPERVGKAIDVAGFPAFKSLHWPSYCGRRP